MSTNIVQHNVLPITVAIVGIPGPAGTSSSKFKFNVDLIGTKNGSNRTFTIPVTLALVANTESIFLNGLLLKRNVGYTISGNTVTMLIDVQSTDYLFSNHIEV